MKTRTILIAAVMFLGLTAAAFAQATFSVGSIPVTAVVSTGQVEMTGDITFSQLNNGNNVALGTITVTYPVPITNDTSTGIGIASIVGFGAGTVTINSVSNGQTTGTGQVTISVPAAAIVNGSFKLTGVRVQVAGTTLTSLSAAISSTNNAITAGQTSVVVISSIAAGIASIKTTTTGSINAVTGGSIVNPVVTVKEGFLNAWGDPTNNTNGGIRITLSAAPPAGVTITFPATANTDGVNPVAAPQWQTMNSDGTGAGAVGTVAFTSSSTTLTVYYRATSTTDPTKQETLTINPTLAVSGTATLPLTAATITYVVSMAPILPAFTSSNAVDTTLAHIPRYAALDVGPATLLNITGQTTTLLVPFAQTAAAIGYNTGIAIANSTTDPGTTAMGGYTTATSQSGTIKFYFYPQLPTPTGTLPTVVTYTTAAGSPGSGLDSSGRLISGSTYSVLLTQLLTAAGYTSDFTGYIFIVTNFTNAHGFWTVSNFTSYSQGGFALVISANRGFGENLNN